MALKLVTPPAVEPVTLEEAKAHLRIDGTEEDVLIAGLIQAAREYCEGFQNRAYITQTWQCWLDNWPGGDEIEIPRPPLQAVNSIKYYGEDGTEYTLSPEVFIVDAHNQPGRVVLASSNRTWPETTLRPTNGICIEFSAGYGGNSDTVPMRVKQAMLLLIGHWHENREAVLTGTISKEIEFAVSSLLWLDRVVPV